MFSSNFMQCVFYQFKLTRLYLSSLYVCMAIKYIIVLFVETPHMSHDLGTVTIFRLLGLELGFGLGFGLGKGLGLGL